MLRTKRTYILIVILGILCAFSVQPALAQDDASACEADTKQYASWLDVLDSMQGEATFTMTSEDETISADGFFALVNNGDISTSDYYLQVSIVEETYDDFMAILVKDNLVAFFQEGWEVEHRGYDTIEFEDAFMQLDTFLTAAFQDLRFIDMSECMGVDELPAGDAIHYQLTIPSLMGRMLITQLFGEEPDDIEFGEFIFDYWLDADKRFLAKLNTVIEGTDTYSGESGRLDLALSIESIDNVQLQIPFVVQFLAMENGIIEPDFVSEIVVVE